MIILSLHAQHPPILASRRRPFTRGRLMQRRRSRVYVSRCRHGGETTVLAGHEW